MKKMLKKIKENWKASLIIFFILELILVMFITPNLYDDLWFSEQITNELNEETGEVIEHTIPDFVLDRYQSWSSRVIIEFTLCSMLRVSKYLWALIEAGLVTLLAYSFAKLFIKNKNKESLAMLLFMILVYPYEIMSQTGWVSTTINYMWPLALGAFSLISIRKIWDGEKIKWYQYILYSASLIFACNQEQACALLFGFYLVYAIYMIMKKKKLHPFMVISLIITIASLIFILTCPGNYVRQEDEAWRFINFETLTFLDKLVLGFTSSFGKIASTGNLVYTMFTLLITIYIFANYKDKLYRVVSLIPFALFEAFGNLHYAFESVFPHFAEFRKVLTTEDTILTVANCDNLYYVFPMIVSLMFYMCIFLSLLLIFKKLSASPAVLMFLAGFASRLIIAFSPTVFVSKDRTMLYLDFICIAISYMIWDKLRNENKDKKELINVTTIFIKFISVCQYLNVLIYCYSTQKIKL